MYAQSKQIRKLSKQLDQVNSTVTALKSEAAESTDNPTMHAESEARQLTETPNQQSHIQTTANQHYAQQEEDIYESHEADFSGNPLMTLGVIKGNKNV